jgi:hypothetical protein
MSHLVLYGGNLCPGYREHGMKICIDCAVEIAKTVPDSRRPQHSRDSDVRLARKMENIERGRANRLQAEVNALRQEISILNDLTPTERKRRAKGTTTDGTVYALLSGYNVKVGWTGRDLQDRLREYPPSTQVLVHFPGKRGDETRIKRKFAHLRTHGDEWFPYAPQVTEWVDQMVREHGAPDPAVTCGPAKYAVPRPHSTAKPQPKGKFGPRHVA